jgi:hypothetical protein
VRDQPRIFKTDRISTIVIDRNRISGTVLLVAENNIEVGRGGSRNVDTWDNDDVQDATLSLVNNWIFVTNRSSSLRSKRRDVGNWLVAEGNRQWRQYRYPRRQWRQHRNRKWRSRELSCTSKKIKSTHGGRAACDTC